jgi:hypothetical protein
MAVLERYMGTPLVVIGTPPRQDDSKECSIMLDRT